MMRTGSVEFNTSLAEGPVHVLSSVVTVGLESSNWYVGVSSDI